MIIFRETCRERSTEATTDHFETWRICPDLDIDPVVAKFKIRTWSRFSVTCWTDGPLQSFIELISHPEADFPNFMEKPQVFLAGPALKVDESYRLLYCYTAQPSLRLSVASSRHLTGAIQRKNCDATAERYATGARPFNKKH